MSFGDFLASITGGGTKTTSSPAPAPAPTTITEPTGTVIAEPTPGDTSQAELKSWADLFSSKPPAPATADQTAEVDLFDANPEQLAGAAGKINMSSVIPQELVAKALAGDSASFMDVINKTAQMSFMMAYKASLQGVKPAVAAQMAAFDKKMPDTFKKLSVDATIQGDPLLSNPALAPVVSSIRQEILTKHPDATPQQLQQATVAYLKSLGFTGVPDTSKNSGDKKPSGGIDWENFL